MSHPVDTIQATKDDDTILAGQDRTHIELVALQTVVDAVVVEPVVECSVLMVTLDDHTADTIAGRYPDVVVLVLGNTADRVIAESVFFCQLADFVIDQIEDVDAFARSNPYQAAGVFIHLSDIVVGKGLYIGGITCQHLLLARAEVQHDKSFRTAYQHVVVAAIEEGGDVVGVQHSVLTGVGRERVHFGIVHL